MKISIFATTDVGFGRDNNEDAFIFCPDLSRQDWSQGGTSDMTDLGHYGSLLVVADGMGGTNAGEVASAIAIGAVKSTFTAEVAKAATRSEEWMKALLCQAVIAADDAIDKHVQTHPDTAGMGTTIVICWITASQAYIAWCGDSRCYVYNATQGLRPLSKDHSYVQELIDQGKLTEEEAFNHPDNNLITRGLGEFGIESVPDVVTCPVSVGDTFLLCSDGLCGYCTKQQIEEVMSANSANARQCAEQLLQKALHVKSEDNICIVVGTILDDDGKSHQQQTKFQQFFKNIFG